MIKTPDPLKDVPLALEKERTRLMGKVGKGSVINFTANILRLVFNMVFFVLLTRYITQKEFGSISLSLTLINVFTLVSCLGIHRVLPSYVAEYMEKGLLSNVKGSMVSSYRITLFVSIGVSAGLFFGAEVMADILKKPGFAPILKQMSVIVPFATSMNMMIAYLQSFHNVWGMHFRESLQPFLRVILMAGVIFFQMSFTSVLWAYIFSVVISCLALVWYSRNRIPDDVAKSSPGPALKEVCKDAFPLLLMGLIEIGLLSSGIIFLGVFASAEKVGLFNAGMRLALLLRILYISTGFIFFPVAAQLYYQNRLDDVRQLYASFTKGLIALTLPLFMIFWLFPDEAMGFFFGTQYAQGNDFFPVLSLGFMIHVLAGLSEIQLIAVRKTRVILFCSSVSFIVNLVLNYLFIPDWEIFGAALSLCIAYAVNNILTSFFLYRITGIHPFTEQYRKLVVSSILLLSVLFGLEHVISIDLNLFAGLVIAVIAVPLIYLLTRAYDPGDIILLALLEKKITRKTTWSDKLSHGLNMSNR